MNIMQMRRGMVASGSGPLYDAEIEYLENNGSAYISTGFINTNRFETYEFKVVCAAVPSSVQSGVFGGGAGFNLSIYNTYRATGQVVTDITPNINRFDEFTLNLEPSARKIVLTINGVPYSGTYNGWSFGSEFLLFWATATPNFTTTKIKSHSLKVDGQLLYDYIPVRIGQVGYMYDKVRGLLFGNAGTGAFILGPDVQ